MPRYLVSYELNSKRKEYGNFTAELKRLGGQRVLESQWAVRSDDTAAELLVHLWTFLDASDDRLLISDLQVCDWAGRGLLVTINDV
jgi:hypothetical protein